MADAEDLQPAEPVETTEEGTALGAGFLASVRRYAFERVRQEFAERELSVLLSPFYDLISRKVAIEVLHQLEQDGFCSFHDHRQPFDPDWVTTTGVCDFCELPEQEHDLLRVCPRKAPTIVGPTPEGTRDDQREPGFYWVSVGGAPAVVGQWKREPHIWLLPGTRDWPGPSIEVCSSRLDSPEDPS